MLKALFVFATVIAIGAQARPFAGTGTTHRTEWQRRLHQYMQVDSANISGWLHPAVASAVEAVQRLHDELNISGSLLEIGVHHGRFYLALDQCRRDGERGFALDLYGSSQALRTPAEMACLNTISSTCVTP